MRKTTDGSTASSDYRDAERLHKAIKFAALAHKNHHREGTETPYIVHPFEAAQILSLERCDADLIIAAILHDTVEDTDTTINDISREFGSTVAGYVSSCTEDKSKSWEERKKRTIRFLAEESNKDILLLVCADKLSNLRSIKFDYSECGDELWERFTNGRTGQKWYFGELINSLEKLQGNVVYEELKDLHNIVFQ